MMDATEPKLLTSEEFWDRYGDREEFADGFRLHYELLDGEVRHKPLPIDVHGEIQSRVIYFLQGYVFAHPIGKSYGEVHFRISARNFFVPDAAFVRNERLSQIIQPGFVPFAPDLAVEIISPSNSSEDMQEKLDLYLAAGTQEVWLIYPKRQEVTVYRANGTWQTIKRGGTLTGGDLLPGLSIPVADLFPTDQNAEAEK